MQKRYIYLIVNLLLLIPGIIFVYSYAYNYIDKEVELLEKKSTALENMQNIYTIITNLQKIRGLNNIRNKNIKISNTIESFKEQNLALSKKIHNNKIEAILKRHPKEALNDFRNYTSDIETLLLIYKLTAYRAHLTLNSDIKEYLLAKSITSRLPYIVEYFARIRGLASGVKEHKLDKRTQLSIKNQIYMIQELLKNAEEVKYLHDSKLLKNLIASQNKEINYIYTELLNKQTITCDGMAIFNHITKNIDSLNRLYNKNMNELINYYQTKIEKKNSIKLFIFIICVISLILVTAINFFYFSKIQRYIKEMEHLNIIDPMTALYNRRFLQNFITKFISQTERSNEIFTVLMLDIDFFKKVNDTYGHAMGDKVIITVAELLRENIRKSDLSIRYGGEEFMILLHYANAQAAFNVATKIREKFKKIEFQTNNNEIFHKTLSIGISEFPKDTKDIWECIKLADKALYSAKNSGRDKVIIYDNTL